MIIVGAPTSFIRKPRRAISIHPAKTEGEKNAMTAKKSYSFKSLTTVPFKTTSTPLTPWEK
jgi:hypothetical protein